jgi:hypothetical protein
MSQDKHGGGDDNDDDVYDNKDLQYEYYHVMEHF